jgi:hypothetical protein
MAADRGRIAALGAIGVVLAAAAWWWSGNAPAPLTMAAQSDSRPGAARRADAPNVVPEVALARLSRTAPEPVDTGRDPFRFAAGVPAAGRAGRAPMPVPGPAVSPVPAGPPPPPPIPMKFIGILSKRAGVRIAMLTDGRGVYYGAEGAVVEGQYRIIRIGLDSIEMAYLDGRGRRTIPLSGS